MKDKLTVPGAAEAQLQAYLVQALEVGVTEITFEYVPEGLEVFFMMGDTGGGMVLRNRRLSGGIMQLLAERVGRSTWQVHGRPAKVIVEQYDSFGERAFRVKLNRNNLDRR